MAAVAVSLGGHGVMLKAGLGQNQDIAAAVSLPKSAFIGEELVCRIKQTNLRATQRPQVAVIASAAEPKWKQKLAAADEHQEKTRQATFQAQEEYRKRQDALRRQSAQSGGEASSLSSLEYVSYLTEEGCIADCTKPGVKASLYAIFDEDKTLCYIGISRQVYQSMRLHFARRPLQCHYVKVMHVTRPSRALLEGTRDTWISENGSLPVGNDNGEIQNLWENPLDCTLLMTDEEKFLHEEAAPGPPKAKVLKNVARRIEKELVEVFKQRQCKDVLRFDPKLKDRGLLDLKGVAVKPDTSVPTSTPTSS